MSVSNRTSRYTTLHSSIWTSKSFKKLSKSNPSGQFLFIFLLTGPHITPLPGIYNIGVGYISDFLNWDIDTISKLLDHLHKLRMCHTDHEKNVVYIRNWNRFKSNWPSNPNVLKGWLNLLDNIPDCRYKTMFTKQLETLSKGLGKPFYKAFIEHFGKLPEPDPEPKPDPEPSPLTPSSNLPVNGKLSDIERKKLADEFGDDIDFTYYEEKILTPDVKSPYRYLFKVFSNGNGEIRRKPKPREKIFQIPEGYNKSDHTPQMCRRCKLPMVPLYNDNTEEHTQFCEYCEGHELEVVR